MATVGAEREGVEEEPVSVQLVTAVIVKAMEVVGAWVIDCCDFLVS